MDVRIVLAEKLGALLHHKNWLCVTAESCTGGGVAAAITEIPGSSAWFDRSFVTYSNSAKQEILGVAESVLKQYGAVSAETVSAMALGALAHSPAHISVAISGIAGPDGGSAEKPVGLVWFGFAEKNGKVQMTQQIFKGDRQAIRAAAVLFALEGLIKIC